MSSVQAINQLLEASELNPLLIQAWQQALPGLSTGQLDELSRLLTNHLEELTRARADHRQAVYRALEDEITRQVAAKRKDKQRRVGGRP